MDDTAVCSETLRDFAEYSSYWFSLVSKSYKFAVVLYGELYCASDNGAITSRMPGISIVIAIS